jgi:hypothetical protein
VKHPYCFFFMNDIFCWWKCQVLYIYILI